MLSNYGQEARQLLRILISCLPCAGRNVSKILVRPGFILKGTAIMISFIPTRQACSWICAHVPLIPRFRRFRPRLIPYEPDVKLLSTLHAQRNPVHDRNSASPYMCVYIYVYYTTRHSILLVFEVYIRSCRISTINSPYSARLVAASSLTSGRRRGDHDGRPKDRGEEEPETQGLLAHQLWIAQFRGSRANSRAYQALRGLEVIGQWFHAFNEGSRQSTDVYILD